MPNDLQAIVLIPHLWVQNANAIAGPMSYGFPAMTAFTGAVHAIGRALAGAAGAVQLDGVGVVCHAAEPQTNRESGYVTRFNLRRDPVGADGGSAALVEEGRMHLDISLVIGIRAGCPADAHGQQALARQIAEQLRAMRLAGGSVLPHPVKALHRAPRLMQVPASDDGRQAMFRQLSRRLLPGFALLGRHALLAEHLKAMRAATPGVSSLDALLDLCALHWQPDSEPAPANAAPGDEHAGDAAQAVPPQAGDGDARPRKTPWQASRRKSGWLVPIPVGYAAVSDTYPPGVVKRSRDPAVPFRFVESVLSLGEWKSPHRLDGLDELLWRYDAQPERGLYLVQTAADSAASAALS